ncbi:hypothetical protein MJO28_000757 [Puccinia striiformis f. sp. tritici]|uniref:Squalene/phytoene synthase n=4 Tax=Puccinia striiformis TaxID=27350 RepID=A0A0L0UTC9_9BASI|nr:hypothetical protein Pst134EB_001674 [Puccinia striiformis f. sp. tritici]KAI9601293.1 hypothetical protein H4Q26_001107 [Puccinia striiformis f. sp. tritici PST-130]KNE90280.1 hypothetical protein PSTG_16272 [Puccinia striiformis f. sp. tritici PST-78]POW07536.1 hypothetical protein PSTT_08178 [Puccinia striiformis]KAI7962663.1 hypothetical protein MJO28_000757 [Puccinia striiformis f. sp. tritici]
MFLMWTRNKKLIRDFIRASTSSSRNNRARLHSSSTSNPIDNCLDTLKRNDPESVLHLNFWPKQTQVAYVVIRAFQAEIEAIPLAVSRNQKPVIAQIRYQWWRDAVDSCFSSSTQEDRVPSNHPLLVLLKPVIKEHKLLKYHFTRIINSSETHYLDPRFTSLTDLVKYSQSTTYATLSLLLPLLPSPSKGKLPLEVVDHGLTHLSTFLTIVKLLKKLPYYIRHRSSHIIPTELMECSEEHLYRFFESRRLHNSMEEEEVRNSLLNLVYLAWSELIAAREVMALDPTHTHVQDFRSDKKHYNSIRNQIFGSVNLVKVSIDRSLIPLFLPATSARSHLSKISKILLANKANRRDSIASLIHSVHTQSDWSLPFKVWFDFKFNQF